MKRTLTMVWRAKDGVVIRMVESNLFMIQFFSEDDRTRVLEGTPWFFDKKLLVLREIGGEEQPSEVNFSKTPF